ncbi:MAG: hypothetical protein U0324_26285 [Polyangiales bacterium]
MPSILQLALDLTLAGRVPVSQFPARGTNGDIQPRATGRWTWRHEASRPNEIRDVSFSSRPAGGFASGWGGDVIKVIECGDVELRGAWQAPGWTPTAGASSAAPCTLPLSPKYLVERLTRDGTAPIGASPLWPAPGWVLDSAIVALFAYELRFPSGVGRSSASVSLDPVAPADALAPDFMLAPTIGGFAATSQAQAIGSRSAGLAVAGSGRATQVVLGAPRVAVFLAWTCLEEARDFEPTGRVSTARCFPHVIVVSDLPWASVTAPIRVERPPASIHATWTPQAYEESVGQRFEPLLMAWTNLGAERSNPLEDAVGAAATSLTSTNLIDAVEGKPPPLDPSRGAPLAPFWDQTFDYVGLAAHHRGPLRVVDSQTPSRAVVRRASGIVRQGGPQLPGGAATFRVPTDIEKCPRQGAYDGLLLAPLLDLPSVHAAAYTGLVAQTRDVHQAPLGALDGLHVQWRWSRDCMHAQHRGWGLGGEGPSHERGAPLVPPNQTVDLSFRSNDNFVYQATAVGTGAHECQVFFHHGMGYSAALDAVDRTRIASVLTARDPSNHPLENQADLTNKDLVWEFPSAFYFMLRYHAYAPSGPSTQGPSQGSVQALERLEVPPSTLHALEQL